MLLKHKLNNPADFLHRNPKHHPRSFCFALFALQVNDLRRETMLQQYVEQIGLVTGERQPFLYLFCYLLQIGLSLQIVIYIL
jgi:hypothetical protein